MRRHTQWAAILWLYAAALHAVNTAVPEPYMDEVFHIPQAARYCAGNFAWDPKITTPPGLYLLTLLVFRALATVFSVACDDAASIRATNVALLPALFAVGLAYYRTIHGPSADVRAAFATLLFPPLFFTAFVYYTDLGSTLLVLAMLLARANAHDAVAAACGILSLLFRQNNIVWILFSCGASALRILQDADVAGASVSQGAAAAAAPGRPVSHASPRVPHLAQLLTQRRVLVSMARVVLSYAPAFVLFAGFLVWNDGQVALGDQSNHQLALHLPQLGYFFAATAAFAWPTLWSGACALARRRRSRTHVALLCAAWLALVAAGMAAVHWCTIVHPFLLSDNRHYTFYVWRRIINARPWTRYALVPVYVTMAMGSVGLLAAQENALWVAGFLVSCALVLVPAPLVEPRYFIVPYVVMRLHWPETSPTATRMDVAWNGLVNAVALCLFCYYPFTWAHEEGTQHFVW
ncbi:dolichyl-P-Glc:Glc2Man9GlcNAc2-PP-dolichol alpha-1,2-glucosyltransferase [Malassezia sp. CBS 17886]|nr:dolichyl-P-Glc:Glc2Man9GlcNAc2-PP-dolichol alpha-1,2-glucosyltransferase [Malassezia sp. CBS 17886]